MAVPDPVLVILALDVVLVAVAVGAFYWADSRTRRLTGHDDWRSRSASLARELHDVLEGREPPIDREELTRALLPMAGRFESAARDTPSDVNPELSSRLYRLAMDCRRLSIEHPHREFTAVAAYPDRIADVAERADRVARDVEASGTVTA